MSEKSFTHLKEVSSARTTAGADTELLVSELRRRIVGNQLPPGKRLAEADLAEEFNVSRARVRDAFAALEARELIERIPNKGAVVMRLEADRILELFEVREVLEAQMVNLATLHSQPEDWEALIDLFGPGLEKSVEDNNFEAYLSAVAQFRQQCAEKAQNETLKAILDGLFDRVQAMTRRLVLVPGRAAEGFRQHKEILRAMQAGDNVLAGELKRNNIQTAREWFLKYKDFLL